MAGDQGDTVEFNPAFLSGGNGRTVDLRRFSGGNALAAGVYRVDVSLNDNPLGSFDVDLRIDAAGRRNEPCLDDTLVRRLGLDASKAPEAVRGVLTGATSGAQTVASACRLISEVADGATARFDPNEQHLDLSIPQAYLVRTARGYVSPERWDSGIDAGLLSYHYSDFRLSGPSGFASEQRFLGLRGGVNVGPWRLRHDGSLSSGSAGRRYQAINTNVQRDITPLLATLTLGDTVTDGQLFDSVGLRGVQLASDDRMLPDSMRGYAPVIRGEARTNARVTVRQNGVVLYETVVPPGPFVFSDLFSLAAGTDLQVTVTEADGSQRVTVVPFSPLAQLLREGASRWGAAAGEMRNGAAPSGTPLLQGTYQRGLTNNVTTEAGVQMSRNYAALLAGGAVITPAGSFALDATVSRFDAPDVGLKHGASFRASYSKYLPFTLTNLTFAAYRNSTVNYYSVSDAMQAARAASSEPGTVPAARPRQRAALIVNQPLSVSTSVALSTYSQSYWNRPGHDRTYQASLGFRVGPASLSLSLSRSLPTPGTVASTRASLNLSMPLGRETGWTGYSQVTRDSATGTALQTSASGTAGEDKQYGVSLAESHNAAGNTVSLGGSYQGSAMQVTGSMSRGPASTQASFTADGGLVVHPGGVTFASTLGDAVGLVYAPSAPGASVQGAPRSEVNGSGYAVMPYLTPYTLNTVELDMKNAPIDSQLDTTVEQAVPRSGAVVRINFKGRRARNVLIEAKADDGKPLPFSATVTDKTGRAVGLVGQGSRIEAQLESDSGQLTVKWGDEAAEQCTLAYHLPPAAGDKAAAFARTEGVCHKSAGEAYSETNKSRDVQ
jgi:outer membrane usher protein